MLYDNFQLANNAYKIHNFTRVDGPDRHNVKWAEIEMYL